MSVTYIGRSTSTRRAADGYSVVDVSFPADVASGDLLVAWIPWASLGISSGPAGWTRRIGNLTDTRQAWTAVYSPGMATTFSLPSLSTHTVVICEAWRNPGVSAWPSETEYDSFSVDGSNNLTIDYEAKAAGDVTATITRTKNSPGLSVNGPGDDRSAWGESSADALTYYMNGVSSFGDYASDGSEIHACGASSLAIAMTVRIFSPICAIDGPLTATGAVGTPITQWEFPILASVTPASYSASGLPPGLWCSAATGYINGTPTTAGTYSSTITAEGSGLAWTDTKTLTWTITGTSAGNPPVITSALAATGEVGVSFSYSITATNSPTSYAAGNLPPGLTVNTSTGVISGTPTTAGVWGVTISATNGDGTGPSAILTITIGAEPTITSPTTANCGVGVPFSYQGVATGSTPIIWTQTGLSGGLTLNMSTGLISGTPTSSGTITFDLTATNEFGTDTITVVVTIGSVPVITSANYAEGQVGVPFQYDITASGSPASYSASGLPPGLAVATGTGIVTGTPTSSGVFAATVSATNSYGTGSQAVQFRITVPGTDHLKIWPYSSLTFSDLGPPAPVVPTASVLLYDVSIEPALVLDWNIEAKLSLNMEPEDGSDG